MFINKIEFLTAKTVEDVNYIDEQDKSVLYHFCKSCNVNVVKLLCEVGANIDYTDGQDKTVLHHASAQRKKGNVDIVKVL